MRRYRGWTWMIVLALTAWGCGKSEPPAAENAGAGSPAGDSARNATAAGAAVKLEGPKQTVQEFLEALRTGNDEKANSLLSAVAREKTAAMDRRLRPSASDTAKFTIDDVKYVGEDGAQVAITWTDIALDGTPSSDKAVWVLRKETEGWRVMGLAVVVVSGENPLVLNFEDPAEVQRKLKEINDRMSGQDEAGGGENLQAEQPGKAEEAIRR
ncbi:MAG: hypothetical protein IT426_08840 [Pirellulales bacterium]|nr:hypothetical protein [Pirellulales bacterium]